MSDEENPPVWVLQDGTLEEIAASFGWQESSHLDAATFLEQFFKEREIPARIEDGRLSLAWTPPDVANGVWSILHKARNRWHLRKSRWHLGKKRKE